MGRYTVCPKTGLKKGTWSAEEDRLLIDYINRHGHWNWLQLPKYAGLSRCGKSCRLRWMNYLRPSIKRGNFTRHEEQLIIDLHERLGNRWSAIAGSLPGRTDNEIKNHWHTHLKKHTEESGMGANQKVLNCKSLTESSFPNSAYSNNGAPLVYENSGATPTETISEEIQVSQGSELSQWWDGWIELTDMDNSHCYQPSPPMSSSFTSSICDSSGSTTINDESEISILDYVGDLWNEPFFAQHSPQKEENTSVLAELHQFVFSPLDEATHPNDMIFKN